MALKFRLWKYKCINNYVSLYSHILIFFCFAIITILKNIEKKTKKQLLYKYI